MFVEVAAARQASLQPCFTQITASSGSIKMQTNESLSSPEQNQTSWVLSSMSALYWRVKGQGKRAIDCLRQALHYAPHHMKVTWTETCPILTHTFVFLCKTSFYCVNC